jgi:uncharacterized membrane protein (GlpM family)
VATRSAISTALTRQTLIRLTAPLVSILAVVLLGQAQGTGAVKRFVWFAMLGWPVWLIFAATLWLGCQRFAWPYALAAAFAAWGIAPTVFLLLTRDRSGGTARARRGRAGWRAVRRDPRARRVPGAGGRRTAGRARRAGRPKRVNKGSFGRRP